MQRAGRSAEVSLGRNPNDIPQIFPQYLHKYNTSKDCSYAAGSTSFPRPGAQQVPICSLYSTGMHNAFARLGLPCLLRNSVPASCLSSSSSWMSRHGPRALNPRVTNHSERGHETARYLEEHARTSFQNQGEIRITCSLI